MDLGLLEWDQIVNCCRPNRPRTGQISPANNRIVAEAFKWTSDMDEIDPERADISVVQRFACPNFCPIGGELPRNAGETAENRDLSPGIAVCDPMLDLVELTPVILLCHRDLVGAGFEPLRKTLCNGEIEEYRCARTI